MEESLFTIGNINLLEMVGTQTTAAKHERAELVQTFVEEINRGRDTYPPVTFRQINGQLRYFSIPDLYVLLRECKNASHFSVRFWWKLKQRRLSTSN